MEADTGDQLEGEGSPEKWGWSERRAGSGEEAPQEQRMGESCGKGLLGWFW